MHNTAGISKGSRDSPQRALNEKPVLVFHKDLEGDQDSDWPHERDHTCYSTNDDAVPLGILVIDIGLPNIQVYSVTVLSNDKDRGNGFYIINPATSYQTATIADLEAAAMVNPGEINSFKNHPDMYQLW